MTLAEMKLKCTYSSRRLFLLNFYKRSVITTALQWFTKTVKMADPPKVSKEIHFANGTSVVSESIYLDYNRVVCAPGTMIYNCICNVIRYFDCSYLEKIKMIRQIEHSTAKDCIIT